MQPGPKNTVTIDDIKKYNQLADLKSRHSLGEYFRYLVIDSKPVRQRWKNAADTWQHDLLADLIPAVEYATGHPTEYQGPRCFFVVMPRGHSKTSTVAQLLNWCLCYSVQHIKAIAAAADSDQAHILLERMQAEAEPNPWLKLKHHNYEVHGTQGTLEILSSDASSAAGHHADLQVVDEISFHKKRDLFDILYSGRNKRPNAVFIVIGNAGVKHTWQHDIYLAAKKDPTTWKVIEVPAFSASWINRDEIEKDRAILLPSIYRRLYLNEWVDVAEECQYVTREQVEACIDDTQYQGNEHIIAIDYGPVKDRTALAVMHQDNDLAILDRLDVWQGSKENRVQLDRVDAWVEEVCTWSRIRKMIVDPWQMESLCQKWEKSINVERYSFQGSGHPLMAENLRTLIVNGRLRIYPNAGLLTLSDGTHEDLVDELSQLIVVEQGNQGKYRFDHLPGKHDDRACVVGMAALGCVQTKKRYNIHEVLDGMIKTKPTKDEIKQEQDQEENMETQYKEIHYVKVYGTWQARPVLKAETGKVTVPLNDYKTQAEAAYAVNAAHKLLSEKEPNSIQVLNNKPMSDDVKKAIEKQVQTILTNRKWLPVKKKAEPKKEEKKAEEKKS